MNNTKPLRCQKYGKPLGYVTVLAKGLTSLPQPLQDEVDCNLHGLFPEEKIDGSNWLKKNDRRML